jgi:hypothetical protein
MLKLRKLGIWVVLLTVSVSSCKDSDKKEEKDENKRKLASLCQLVWNCGYLFGKSST